MDKHATLKHLSHMHVELIRLYDLAVAAGSAAEVLDALLKAACGITEQMVALV